MTFLAAPDPPVRGRHRALGPTRSKGRLSAAALVVTASITAGVLSLAGAQAPAERLVAASAVRGPAPAITVSDPANRLAVAPVGVRIPSIGVDTSLDRLGLDGAGALVPPADFARAGWFTGSPVPGDVGPAVIAGHVDSYEGPAVFFRLRELAAGDEVLVDLADGTTVRFTVTAAQTHPKDRFPTEDVYGPTQRVELRLITCGGDFDRERRSYDDNVVVSAVRSQPAS